MKRSALGFTLVELLVVIAIIAILAVVGTAVFRGVTSGMRDSRRKADVESLAKAYEAKYVNTGSYQTVTATDFSGGGIPQDPIGGSYYNNLSSGNASFRVCAALESNSSRTCSSPATNCYCLSSAQGSYSSGGGGGSIDHPVSCDPNGTLGLGLVGYWKLDEGVGTISQDATSYHNNVTSFIGTPTWVSGKFGQALSFNGNTSIGDYAVIPYNSVLNVFASNNWTVSLWAKPITSTYPSQSTYVVIQGPGHKPRIVVNISGASFEGFVGGTFKQLVYSGGININQWNHVVFVGNGVNNIIYINGNQGVSASYQQLESPFTELRIGATGWADENFWGDIDDVRMYNRVLSASEISTLYNSGNGCIP